MLKSNYSCKRNWRQGTSLLSTPWPKHHCPLIAGKWKQLFLDLHGFWFLETITIRTIRVEYSNNSYNSKIPHLCIDKIKIVGREWLIYNGHINFRARLREFGKQTLRYRQVFSFRNSQNSIFQTSNAFNCYLLRNILSCALIFFSKVE